MRKIRLTESELIKFIKQIIKEAKHEFQNYEDSILDKISSDGIESLSDIEKNILIHIMTFWKTRNNVSSFNTRSSSAIPFWNYGFEVPTI